MGSWEEVWLPSFSLGLPVRQPVQLSKALRLPGCGRKVMIWLILRSEQSGAKEQNSTGLWHSLPFQREIRVQSFLSQWPPGSQIRFRVGIMSFDTVLTPLFCQWPQFSPAVYCGALTLQIMKEAVFSTSVNIWEVVCSERCRIDLAPSLRAVPFCFVSQEELWKALRYRHPLIRLLQWNLYSTPLMA